MKEVSQIFFVSKKDAFYSVVIRGTIVLILSVVIRSIIAFSASNFIEGLVGFIIVVLLIWAWFSTGYQIVNDIVKVKAGPFKKTINIQEINKISKRKSVWTAAALATDRLVIQYGKYNLDILVSPRNESDFIKLLLSKKPQIQIEKALSQKYKI
ncbi:PH domain-containing protein [Oceanobacillus iheyensis]|uniref:PH domain-containing protein n=1 Tax=Oceanobacillus iheyensis TaxID=182710 RepID=UPI00135F16C0|nr:PH domain-containing protein [Oceanobacillus iheyensis]